MSEKLLIETFMLYDLSCKRGPVGLFIFQIKSFMESLGIDISSEGAFTKKINRYIDDLQNIGALKTNAKRSSYIERSAITNESTEYSVIKYDDYCTNLRNFSEISKELKPLYRIAKILNSECGEDVENDDTYFKFRNSYFSNGLEHSFEEEAEIVNSLYVIRNVFEVDDETTISTTKYNNIETLFIKLKSGYGYNR